VSVAVVAIAARQVGRKHAIAIAINMRRKAIAVACAVAMAVTVAIVVAVPARDADRRSPKRSIAISPGNPSKRVEVVRKILTSNHNPALLTYSISNTSFRRTSSTVESGGRLICANPVTPGSTTSRSM
jgi:hypothetical protein